jgi:hypothetical protein
MTPDEPRHWECTDCGALFFRLEDALRHEELKEHATEEAS